MPSVGQYSVFKQTKKQKEKVNICLWSLPTELALFCQDISLFTPFFRYMQHSSRKSQAWSANTIFECSIRSQAWLAMISSQSLWAPPKPQIWWGVGWGFPYWHLDLDELLLAPGFLCSWYLSGRGQEQSGEMEEMVTPFSCHTASNFWLYLQSNCWSQSAPKTSQVPLGAQTISCHGNTQNCIDLCSVLCCHCSKDTLRDLVMKSFWTPSDHPIQYAVFSSVVLSFLFLIKELSHRQGRDIPWLK